MGACDRFAMSKLPNKTLIWASVAVSFCGMIGTAYGPILNNPSHAIKEFLINAFYTRWHYLLSSTELDIVWGALCAMNPLGALFGSMIINRSCERFGRRDTSLIINSVITIVAAIFQYMSKATRLFEFLYIGRFVAGVSFGLAGADSIYLVECSPDQFRGFAGAMPNVALTFWYMLACFLGHPDVLGNPWCWEYLLLWPAIPAIAGIFLALYVPESPKYLYLSKGNTAEALSSLDYWFPPNSNYDDVLAEYDRERKYLQDQDKPSWKAIWSDTRLKRGMIVSVMTITSLTTVGIEIVAQYSTTIFEDAGMSAREAAWCTTFTLAPALLLALYLMPYLDKVGRRPMIITAMMGAAVAHFLLWTMLQWSVVAIIAVILITLCHFAGVGPVGRFIVAEICPQVCRSKVAGIGWVGKWTLAVIYTTLFPVLINKIGPFTFLLTLIVCLIFIVWFLKFLPETKQRPVDEIVDRFNEPQDQIKGRNWFGRKKKDAANGVAPDERTPLVNGADKQDDDYLAI